MKIRLPKTEFDSGDVDEFYIEILDDDENLQETRKTKIIGNMQLKVALVPNMNTGEYEIKFLSKGQGFRDEDISTIKKSKEMIALQEVHKAFTGKDLFDRPKSKK